MRKTGLLAFVLTMGSVPSWAQDMALPQIVSGALDPAQVASDGLAAIPVAPDATGDGSSQPADLQTDASITADGSLVSNVDGLIDGDAAALAAVAPNGTRSEDTVLDPATLANLQANDPELGVILSNIVLPKPDLSLRWDESASRAFYSSDLGLRWQHTLGDYAPTALGSATVRDANRPTTVSIPVLGNDFYILGDGDGTATYLSRYGSETLGPVLIVNGTVRYRATRAVALSASLSGTLQRKQIMSDRNAMLIAFDNYTPQAGDKAKLQLTSIAQYGAHTITAYPPNIVRAYPVIDAIQDGTVVANFQATDFTSRTYSSVQDGYLTSYWENARNTAISQLFSLPPAQEYFMTTIIRLHSDWSNQGGKLPGLANTGQLDPDEQTGGVNCSPAGWGGRTANGCRWSARTGWGGRVNGFVGLHTYYYALSPNYGWGYIQNWPTPIPVSQWVAYVQRVRVNTPGQADGRLSYWLCTQDGGCLAQFDRQDIQWRSADVPQALINEAWADVYCGGLGCPGPDPWPRSTIDLKRMTVTVGLPDMAALETEIQALNAAKP